MGLGAFLGGLLVAETEYRHQMEGDIQPFRGILIALFFVSVGMGLNLDLLVEKAPLIAGLLATLLLSKALVLFVACRAFRLPPAVSMATALMLAEGGEFGFVLFALARRSQVLSDEVSQTAGLVLGLSMLAAPGLVALARAVLRRLEQVDGSEAALAHGAREIKDHVLIAGFGRVGQTLGLLLESSLTPYLALDLDPDRIAVGRSQGLPVFFGDACRRDVLRAAGAERARMVVITLDDPESASRSVQLLRQLSPEIPILARARDLNQCERLIGAGATDVVPEMVEGSLQLGGSLLRILGKPADEVSEVLEEFRRQTYSKLAEVSANSSGLVRPTEAQRRMG